MALYICIRAYKAGGFCFWALGEVCVCVAYMHPKCHFTEKTQGCSTLLFFPLIRINMVEGDTSRKYVWHHFS